MRATPTAHPLAPGSLRTLGTVFRRGSPPFPECHCCRRLCHLASAAFIVSQLLQGTAFLFLTSLGLTHLEPEYSESADRLFSLHPKFVIALVNEDIKHPLTETAPGDTDYLVWGQE